MPELTHKAETLFTATTADVNTIKGYLKEIKKAHDNILSVYDSGDEIVISEFTESLRTMLEGVKRSAESAIKACDDFYKQEGEV